MALWLLHNFLAAGRFTNHPPPKDYPVPMMLRDVVEILWSWAQTNTAAALAPFVCVLVVVHWRRLTVADWRPFWLFGGFALTYIILFIAIISLLVGIYLEQGVGERLLTPLYIPLLMAGVLALDRVLRHEWERRPPGSISSRPVFRIMMPAKTGSALAAIVVITLSLGVASQMASNVSTIAKENRGDLARGINRPRWTGSETRRYVRQNLVWTQMYSNLPGPLSIHIGKNQKFAPCHRLDHGLTAFRARMERVQSQDGAYVVWFTAEWIQYRYDYDEADLRSFPGLEPVAELADGIVFKVAR